MISQGTFPPFHQNSYDDALKKGTPINIIRNTESSKHNEWLVKSRPGSRDNSPPKYSEIILSSQYTKEVTKQEQNTKIVYVRENQSPRHDNMGTLSKRVDQFSPTASSIVKSQRLSYTFSTAWTDRREIVEQKENLYSLIVDAWLQGGEIRPSNEIHKALMCLSEDNRILSEHISSDVNDHNVLARNSLITSLLFAGIKCNKIREIVLNTFIRSMPKGGDPHIHTGGAIPGATLLKFARENGLYVDIDTKNQQIGLFHNENKEGRIPAKSLLLPKYKKYRQDYDNRTSMKGCEAGSKQGNAHFFTTFEIRESIMRYMPLDQQVRSIVDYALNQDILWMPAMKELLPQELPSLFDKYDVEEQDQDIEINVKEFDEKCFDEALHALQGKWLDNYVSKWSKDLRECNRSEAHRISLKLNTVVSSIEDITSPVVVRYIVEVMRDLPPHKFFASIAAAMALSNHCPDLIAGITIDGPEDSDLALEYWDIQKKILKYLSPEFGNPYKTLHGGEWEISNLEEAQARIDDCISVQAQCIGHATSIVGQKDHLDTLDAMLKANVLVEICMRSSLVLLGLPPHKHPIALYWNKGVPVALGSDDPSITESDLTSDIVDAITACDWNYEDLKNVMRNALAYSSLPGDGIFNRIKNNYELKTEYRSLLATNWEPNEEVLQRISNSQKAYLQIRYERKLAYFEAQTATRIFRKTVYDPQ